MHLGDGGGDAPQRYEYSFTEAANTSCFNYAEMQDDPSHGLHSLVGIVEPDRPFDMKIQFDLNPSSPSMQVLVSQEDGPSKTIYDSSKSGAQGSNPIDMSDLVLTMKKGYWLLCSYWQGYSPEGPDVGGGRRWWNYKTCKWNDLCGGGYWKISDIKVTAESEISPS